MPSGAFGFFRRFFFSTGIPTSSYFLAASNMGWEARRPDLARKFARMGAGRLGGLRVLIDWNTHFVVFSGGFEQGLGGSAARSSWKTRKNGGWEARRLDQAGMITPPPPPCCSRNPGRRGWWAVPRVPIWVFVYPQVEVGLKSRNNGLSGPTGVVPTLGGLQ